MRAARWYGYKDIRIEDIPVPQPKEGEVLVKVKWAGICGTDRHEYVGPNFIPVNKPHRLTGRTAPLTMGHEFSGVIEKVGSGVKGWRVGDRVTATGTLSCGNCRSCKSGKENICEKLGFVGVSDDGAFADYVMIKEKSLFKVPDNVSLKHAVLSEPLACGQHAVNLLGADFTGKTVVVSGSGIIGLSCAIASIQAGAAEVLLSGMGEDKKKIAEKIGCIYHNVKDGSLKDACLRMAGASLADIVFECVGIQSTLDECVQVMKPGASLMVMGVFEKQPVFPMNDFQEGERKLFTSQAHLREIGQCLAKMSEGAYPYLPEMITGEVDLNRIAEDGFDEMNDHPNEHIKMLVKIDER